MIFDGAREEWEPAPGRNWRRLWHRHGPTLLIAVAAGMLLGSYAALLCREFGL